MRHLCDTCSTLVVERELSPDSHRVLKPIYDGGVDYLSQSAEGLLDGKPCHFCALILRSLKDPRLLGTLEEKTCLPSGPVKLRLSGQDDALKIVAMCCDSTGHPIHLSLGADESCRGSEVSSSASSDQVFSQIRSWCNDCMNKHSRCALAKSSVSWLPSRVVDLGSGSGPLTARILETRGTVGQYITLTHRWTALTRPSATTTENYESRKHSINVTSLSLTFQDAFEATRALGLRYLWIDALCIIQDSPSDWSIEASNMRSIYEFAWLNIAVAGSEREDGRLFMKRRPRINRPCKLPDSVLSSHLSTFDSPIYAYLSSQSYAQAVFDGFLTRRGWILQERILSPRTIYFGQEEVYWECSTTTASETMPWGWEESSPLVKFNSHDLALNPSGLLDSDMAPIYNTLDSPRKIRRVFGSLHHNEALSPLYNYWYRLVEAYTSKSLTKATDRLPAIFGLAQAIHKSGMPYKTFSECYQNGVWLLEPASFLWYLSSSPEKTLGENIDGAPSYSWGSWSDPSSFLAKECIFVDESHEVDKQLQEILGGHPAIQNAIITNVDVERFPHILKPGKISGMVQVLGQLDIATLGIKFPQPPVHLAEPSHPIAKTAKLEEGLREARLIYRNDSNRYSDIIIDKYPDEELRNWLVNSGSTLWLLKLAIGDERLDRSVTRANWVNSGAHNISVAGYQDFGLILIPTKASIDALKDIQDMLEPWNIPPSDKTMLWSSREASPPLVDNKMTHWMPATERLNPFKLLGPHNTSFRRVGIYRSSASNYKHFQEHVTTVLLT